MRKASVDTNVTRQAILDAALIEFSRNGYVATHLEDIAKHAHVTRGAIYQHFQNKAGLLSVLLQDVTSGFDRIVAEAIDERGTFAEIIIRILVRSLIFYTDNAQYRASVALAQQIVPDVPELEELSSKQKSDTEIMIQQLAGFLSMGIENGEIRAGVDPLETARTFIAIQNGLMQLWSRAPFPMEPAAQAAGHVYIQGICPGETQ